MTLPDKELRDLLERIRRLNVMLWAFDYPAADSELITIEGLYASTLRRASEEEGRYQSVKHSIIESQYSLIRNRLSGTGLSGERLQVELQREIVNLATQEVSQQGFEPAAMNLSGLAAVIIDFSERVEQAKKIAPSKFETREEAGELDSFSSTHTYVYAKEKGSDTETIFRAYRLDVSEPVEFQSLLAALRVAFESEDELSQGIRWRPLSTTFITNVPLPYKLRAFFDNAMATMVVYDAERYRLEIIHDRDPDGQIAVSIAKRVQQVMNELVAPK